MVCLQRQPRTVVLGKPEVHAASRWSCSQPGHELQRGHLSVQIHRNLCSVGNPGLPRRSLLAERIQTLQTMTRCLLPSFFTRSLHASGDRALTLRMGAEPSHSPGLGKGRKELCSSLCFPISYFSPIVAKAHL